MNIAIVAPSSVPFVVGGAEKFWWGLHQGLTKFTPHFVELIKVPCKERNFWDLIDSYKKFFELDLSHFDMVITTKYPAWMVQHHNHVVYLQHTLRGLYDTYHLTNLPTECTRCSSDAQPLIQFLESAPKDKKGAQELFKKLEYYKNSRLAASPDFAFPGPLARKIIHFFDACGKNPEYVSGYAAISHNVKNRADYFPEGATVDVIHHPSDLPEFKNNEGRYIFTASRLVGCKRIDTLIKAMAYVKEDIPLLIAGCGPELERYKEMAEPDRRIKFLGFTSDEEIINLYSEAIAVPFLPRDEDYGLITIEAMMSGKPVVTANDSGGVCEFVENGVTGFCVGATPKEIGEALQEIVSDKDKAKEMGQRARKLVENITWETTANRVLSLATSNQKERILILNTFSSSRPMSGGQKRVYNICKNLANKYEVVAICYGNSPSGPITKNSVDNIFNEISVPLSEQLISKRNEIREYTTHSVDDIAAMLTCQTDEKLISVIKSEMQNCRAILCAHPYMFPVVSKTMTEKDKVWYDAHNVEYLMKKCILEDKEELDEIISSVFETEKQCCERADIITCCSKEDKQFFIDNYSIDEKKAFVVCNGVDIENIPYTSNDQRNENKKKLGIEKVTTAIFIGSNHGPNIKAVNFLLDAAKKCPEVIFLVVGSVAHNFNLSKNYGNLYFVGEVTEKEKNLLLASCDLGLNPIDEGSGTNLKIVEYAAAGLHVVSTLHGARGLLDGFINSIVTANLEDFPATIARLASDKHSSEDTRKRLHDFVEEHYSWEKLVSPVTERLETGI